MPRTGLDIGTGIAGSRSQNTGDQMERLKRIQRNQVVPIRGPWGGFVPDIEGPLAGPNTASASNGVVSAGRRQTSLTFDDGWDRFENSASVTLPLGTVSPPATVDVDDEPVIGLFEYLDGDSNRHRLALTAKRPGVSTHGHLYELQNNLWTHIPFDDGTAADPQDMDASDANNIMTFVYYPLLRAAPYTRSAGGAATSANGVCVFTNGIDAPHFFASNIADRYDRLDLFFGGSAPNNFLARTVAVFADRLIFFNTTEGGAFRPNRIRWSAPGTADIDAATLGAGFVDLDQVGSTGLAILPLGDALALYFENGVAILRRTGLFTQPFSLQNVQKQRGIVGTQAVVDLGSGVHFGIFTDGWFFFNSSGAWREAGVVTSGNSVLRKWSDTFYRSLAEDQLEKIQVGWDQRRRVIRVAYPESGQSDPSIVWNYHVDTDTVWPDEQYDGMPDLWAPMSQDLAAIETWDTIDTAGTTWAAETRNWNDFDVTATSEMVHGTGDGMVFIRRPGQILRDTVNPVATWTSNESDLGNPSTFKRLNKLTCEYVQIASGADITLEINNGNNQTSAAFTPDKGNNGERQKDFITANTAAERFGWGFSTSGEFEITGIELSVIIEGSETQAHGS